MSEPVYERATQLLEADLGDDLIALDAKGGNCFGFNPVARNVWRHLAVPKSFDDIKEALLAEYDVDSLQCQTELRKLLDDLIDKGLVRKVAS